MDWLFKPESWAAILTLVLLEIVLSVDNVLHLSLAANRLPKEQQHSARLIGLVLAMVMRIALLSSIVWFMHHGENLLTIFGHHFSLRDLIMVGGGSFLAVKSLRELLFHGAGPAGGSGPKVTIHLTLGSVLLQIVLLDIVFSIDSIIAAIGMVKDVRIMITAVVISVAIIAVCTNKISDFINAHPRMLPLALFFLLLVGLEFVAEAFAIALPKGLSYVLVLCLAQLLLKNMDSCKKRTLFTFAFEDKQEIAKAKSFWSAPAGLQPACANDTVISALTKIEEPCPECWSPASGLSSCLNCGAFLMREVRLGHLDYSFSVAE